MGVLENKVAVVTGGTRGLGRAIAEAYALEGAAVVVASRSAPAVKQTVEQLTALGARASGLAADVASLEQVEALAEHAVQTYGQLDIWVNNAGTAGPYGPTVKLQPQDFEAVVQTNILGVYHGSRAALRRMLPQGAGKLINLLGHGYRGPVAYQNAYAPSKAWVKSFTLALAEESHGSGVDVFAFNPGLVLTELLTEVEVIEGSQARLERFPQVLAMFARPPQVAAQKAVWLASSASDGNNGRVVSLTSPLGMVWRSLAYGLKRLAGQAPEPVEVHLRSLPPAE